MQEFNYLSVKKKNIKKMKKAPFILLFILGCLPELLQAQSIVTTKHNLSVSGTGTVKATSESEICIFCHTPHNSSPKAPLWNKTITGTSYTLYNSSTLDAVPGQPDGSSVLCLSCHDGTIALGDVTSRVSLINMSSTMPSKSNLGTDLSNDHPISFTYNASLATADGQLKSTPLVTSKLDNNSKLQCTSCHDPHKETNPKFLVASPEFSALCFNCHNRNYWASSTHNTSTKVWNNSGTNPWAHVDNPYPNVSQNACANCHDPHNANGKPRLLKYTKEEDNCFDCHNGNVASKNVQADFVKTYKHNVAGYTGVHDPTEAISVTNKHVECQDCHNPHASNATTATAPNVNGFNIGVSGINQAGTPVSTASFTYEICYKCHAGNAWSPSPSVPRVLVQNNVRLEFNTANPSYHPIAGAGKNNNVPSLISPLTESSIIYCTDCHASNNTSGPAGPHGSIYPQILKYNYNLNDNISESSTNYALCYSCHSRNSIINDNSFKEHNKHIRGERANCNVCHDSHGISSTQGNSTNNSNLINFRTDIVTPVMGQLQFRDTGTGRGNCTLRCHGYSHINESY
jgi:predicted CXXCH cytochrome family protein